MALLVVFVLIAGCVGQTAENAGKETAKGSALPPIEQCSVFDRYLFYPPGPYAPAIWSGNIWGMETYKGKEMCRGHIEATASYDVKSVLDVYFTLDRKELCYSYSSRTISGASDIIPETEGEGCFTDPEVIKNLTIKKYPYELSMYVSKDCPSKVGYDGTFKVSITNSAGLAPLNLDISGDGMFLNHDGRPDNCTFRPQDPETYCFVKLTKLPGEFTISYSTLSETISCP